jgi:hypothetical protein
MKTSHTSDELNKKGGVHKSGTYDLIGKIKLYQFYFALFVLYFIGETFLNNIIKLTTIYYYFGFFSSETA